MIHRIFIAINLTDSVKAELLSFQERWPELPARWTAKENLHLTLAFLGNTEKGELEELKKLAQEIGKRHKPFVLEFTKILYGPVGAPPRMIWAVIQKSSELAELQKDVENTLAQSEQIRSIPEKREYSPHLTLARLREWEFRRMDPEERPEVSESVSLQSEVRSIEIIESKLKRSGAQYSVVQSFPLLERLA